MADQFAAYKAAIEAKEAEITRLRECGAALAAALEAMKMTCHNCGEKQTLSMGVTEALKVWNDGDSREK